QKFFRLRRSKIQVYQQKFAYNINEILHYYNVSLKAYIRTIKFYQRLVLTVAFIILGIEALLMFPNIFQKLRQYTLNLEQAHQLTQDKNKELSQAYEQLKEAESKTRDQANNLRESNVNLMKTQQKLKLAHQELQHKNEELEKTHNVWDMNRQLEEARFFDASISHFAEVMRWKTNQNIYTWSENLLSELVPYVKGLQATLYVYDDEKELLFLTGSYAVEQDKIIDNTEVGLGEGLIGQVAKSQNPIYLNLAKSPIPIKAPAGLLGTQMIEPKAIYVLPCNYNENIAGVIEMTLSQTLAEKHIQLLERIGESVGAHLNALQDQRRINQLFAESKMAQKKLRRSIKKIADNEERFRKLSEVTQEGILFLIDNIIKDANMVLVRMMGYESFQELQGKHYINLIAPKYRFEIAERKMLSDGQEHETVACKKNNETFPVEIQSRNVKYQDEWITVISIRDITEKKRTQKQLEEANLIARLVTELEKKNKDITSSIEYAQRIQEAILPGDKLIGKGFVEHFVLYIPKDIVSGDFYWFADKNEHALIAAVDCTGHGVPGAFMSIIGYSNLNKIVIEQGLTDPASILKKLDQEVTEVLKQQETDSRSRDGMDLALCSLNIYEKKMKFAGAYRPLYLIREGELQEYKGSPFPIGGNFKYKRKKVFKSHEIHLHKGDSLYIFSDGFVDQFGGPENRKYMTKK
ncbi:MAG: SpoIIE family protein phosphatase, partial [Bacteroidota bacterium]